MSGTFSLSRFVIVLSIILILAACGGGQSPAAPAPTNAPTLPASATPTETPPAPAPVTVGGPGAFNLPQPNIHLDMLDRYEAELLVQFNGEQTGETVERSIHLTLAYAGPEAQVTRLESSASDGNPAFLLAGQVAGTRFVQSASDTPCSSLADSQDTEAFTFGDPWRELPAVYGAELVGTETVNDFETEHYTFDQRAIRWAAGATAQGELWIAKGGGFLVRYRLTMQAPPGILGAASGAQTWQFDLRPLAADANLLPEGCAPVLTNFPLLPNAEAILRLPGYLSYTTSNDAAATGAFYRQALTAAGWKEQDAFNATPERAVLLFVRPIMEGETVTTQEIAAITLNPASAGVEVEIQVLSAEVPPATAAEP